MLPPMHDFYTIQADEEMLLTLKHRLLQWNIELRPTKCTTTDYRDNGYQ